ncbi:hypothetical protein A8139_04980 [Marinomonas primoryensis]|uniref:HTH lysR-type domain-containing protein n=1 Tax=Marinomonas primoryensis TaxID=178399 RepID=A0A2Z4PPP7_9GAMM|nr:LysR family transcriptional regulator [Marinomonas primoryensis]AWX99429.1 hypothetical protein A8139_04980 [Marinomonas primoryensis]
MGHPYTALHTFHLAVRFQSLKCTADHLHLTESAVSHQIKRLETQLGYTLFYKSGRQLKVTSEGKRLSSELSASFDHIDQVLSDPANTPINAITIYCLPSLIEFWLLPRLLKFKETHPNSELVINYHSSSPDYLDEHSLRIGSHEKDKHSPYMRSKILSGETIPVCSPIYMKQHQSFSSKDLLEADLLHDHTEQSWKDWFVLQGLALNKPPQLLYEDFHLLKMATVAAQGIALCPEALIQNDLEDGRLIALSTQRGNIGRYYAIERNKYADTGINTLIKHLI